MLLIHRRHRVYRIYLWRFHSWFNSFPQHLQYLLMCSTLGAPHTEILAELMQLCSGELCYTIPDRCGLFSSDLKASLQLVLPLCGHCLHLGLLLGIVFLLLLQFFHFSAGARITAVLAAGTVIISAMSFFALVLGPACTGESLLRL